MPTYVCYARAGTLTAEQREKVARGITTAHSEATGAPTSFTQVVFQELGDGEHFIGGQPASPGTVWVHGNIRAGRAEAMKDRLLTAVCDLVGEVAGQPSEQVWVYLSELVPSQMIEFGQVLPPHGQEENWLQGLSPSLRKRLQAFEAAIGGA
jgi:phenylpyruvate tautomerase PptA (4-oxalocrotonate tautomerase family)